MLLLLLDRAGPCYSIDAKVARLTMTMTWHVLLLLLLTDSTDDAPKRRHACS